ncbi:MAG TPA: FadD3 family acyl-CoA ligase [Acidimicrobiales bacterium]|nr:FadD3 family acyl-CoA ligase [Acidimicrobiales bacterium]
MAETIPSVLHAAARMFGRDEAIVGEGERMTFSELEGRAEAAARALVASGLGPGDRVAIWAPNSARWIEASFAVYLAGCVLVPLNTRYKGEEAGHVLRTSQARMLLTVTDFLGSDYLGMLETVAGLDAVEERIGLSGPGRDGITAWDSFVQRGDATAGAEVARREAAVRPDDMCDIVFTSGTTGAPKGAMLTHGASVGTYRAWSELVGLRRGDRYLIVYPFFHTAGLKSGILACVLTGATIHPHPVFDVPSVMRRVADERITMLPGPPTVFQSILEHADLATFDLSSLRLSVTGAAVVPVEIVRRMREELTFETVVTGYGLTETTGTVSMCRHDDPPDVIARTVGRPLPGVEVRVVDDGGIDVDPGRPGELLVRGLNVMKGYFNNPGATAEAIDADGFLRTGDIGFVDDSGNLHITDRKKDMYIVGGFNAYPAEIEAAMLEHPGLAQVAVVGVPDARLGEVGVAFVIPRAGHDLDPGEVIEWCRARMANFKVPRHIVVVDALPLNPSGKVMKFRLRDEFVGREAVPGPRERS